MVEPRSFFRMLTTWAALLPLCTVAQNLTGVWRGYFITDQFEQYKFEIQIEQIGPSVQGVSYSYLNKVFYAKTALRGNFESGNKLARVEETQSIEIKMSDDSHSCLMNCNLFYVRSGREEFLEGTFGSKFEKSAPGVRKGADCGDGKVYLRRVTDSDFYLEPFLKSQARNKPVYDNQAPPNRNKSNPTPPTTRVVNNTENPTGVKNPSKITMQGNNLNSTVATFDKSPPPVPQPQVLKNRINELNRELIVKDRSVRVRLYDNGEIDGDTISVYLGNKLVLAEKRLTAAPLEIRFELTEEDNEQEITMVAENLGTIPPNTSLMIVEAGGERFEIRITSTEQKNAVVRFRYRPE